MPNILSTSNKGWARDLDAGLPVFFMDQRAARRAGPTEQSVAFESSPKAPTRPLEPVQPDTTNSQNRAAAPALVVDVRGVSLTFQTGDGEVQALSNVDLPIGAGDFVSFIGPSGCGKTTLLRVIADLEHPTAGTVLVNGVSSEQVRLQRHYGYIFQAPALYPWRTIERNVALPLEIMGFDAAERRKRVGKYLKLVNLSGFNRKFPWQLSGGMQQRASIARALSFDPALLLMDEPFGALDEQTRMVLGEDLSVLLSRTEKTIVFVTHSLGEAVFLADRVAVFSARPGTIKQIIAVDEPHPRKPSFMTAPKFHALRDQLYGLLHDEIRKTVAESARAPETP